MSSELMGIKSITSSIGFPLPSLARKNGRKILSERGESVGRVLLQVSSSLKQVVNGALEGDSYIERGRVR